MDLTARLDEQVAKVQGQFEALNGEFKSLSEKRAELDRRLSLIREEQVRLQGDYRALMTLKNGGGGETPEAAGAGDEKPN